MRIADVTQRLWQCEHVAIFQLCDDQSVEIRAEIRAGKISQIKDGQGQNLKIQGDRSSCIGHFLSAYRTFPIGLTADHQLQSEVWGYILIDRTSKQQPLLQDVPTLFSQLLAQLSIAIQQINIRTQHDDIMRKMEAVERSKLEILRSIAHEYRTPLTKILAAASTLELHSTALDAVTGKRFLTLIQEQTRYLSGITEQILSKAEVQDESTSLKC